MIFKAPAKVNLGLHIKGKRDDGFHELESIFYKIPLYDFIELIPSNRDSFRSYNIDIPGEPENNLCLKAMNLLREDGYSISYYDIHLLKNIPIGAGLGGGSSDAVAVLSGLNQLENLGLSEINLMDLASKLGSDCPFFCIEGSAKVTGRGEIIEKINFNLYGKHMILINPGIHISTSEAYSSLDLKETSQSVIDWRTPIDLWKSEWKNDFEKALSKGYPELQRIKAELESHGALYSSLSGSGSSVFGIFTNLPEKKLFKKEGYSEWSFSF